LGFFFEWIFSGKKNFYLLASKNSLMKSFLKASLFVLFLMVSGLAFSQTPQYPIVKNYGGIYEIPDATERPDPNAEYKIIVDMTSPSENNKEISRFVDNIARMMNLHGLAGVPQERLKVKVVIHGGAIFTLLNNENYKQRFEVDNGQSLIARKLTKADLWPGVRIAHSAMTTITTYVPQGYVLLKF